MSFNNVKLEDKDVYYILFLNRVRGWKPYQIAELFPVSKVTIRSIVNGRSRKDCYFAFLEFETNHPEKIRTLFD